MDPHLEHQNDKTEKNNKAVHNEFHLHHNIVTDDDDDDDDDGFIKKINEVSNFDEQQLILALRHIISSYCFPSESLFRRLAKDCLRNRNLFIDSQQNKWIHKFIDYYRSFFSIKDRFNLQEFTHLPNSENLKTMELFYERLNNFFTRFKFKKKNIFKIDETVYSLQYMNFLFPMDRKIFFDNKGIHILDDEDLIDKFITITECIIATGEVFPPYLVVPNDIIATNTSSTNTKISFTASTNTFFRENPNTTRGWKVYNNNNNNINTDGSQKNIQSSLAWLTDIFAKRESFNIKENKLLLIDEESRYLNIPFILKCKELNIKLFLIPNYATSWFQPLEISTFGLIRGYVDSNLPSLTNIHDNNNNPKDHRLQIDPMISNLNICLTTYSKARSIGFYPFDIKSGFKNCGILPLNKNIVQERIFSNEPSPNMNTITRNLPNIMAEHLSTIKPNPCTSGILAMPQKRHHIHERIQDIYGLPNKKSRINPENSTNLTEIKSPSTTVKSTVKQTNDDNKSETGKDTSLPFNFRKLCQNKKSLLFDSSTTQGNIIIRKDSENENERRNHQMFKKKQKLGNIVPATSVLRSLFVRDTSVDSIRSTDEEDSKVTDNNANMTGIEEMINKKTNINKDVGKAKVKKVNNTNNTNNTNDSIKNEKKDDDSIIPFTHHLIHSNKEEGEKNQEAVKDLGSIHTIELESSDYDDVEEVNNSS
ncbi:uncharacterized protein NDAI_0B00710 [Naumovozyma dairenensis CBS 421]|uniref:DDE-1 domain-containing protein n=1 Tax=Naumovozyma dairenensis (strain ATCC 10597 / BCRC 20456 / CBS 421 / NBRC 0211 / NRRL Y-12639) TaxID=1071378 RepID=G0W5P4_NAUDC|nr:hypothetical protein NDAI_0B00710 [Naumovozyma dairenensis CBS 421]CCD23105.1 hypothetical protein NDAI_0B00710 [Naumovozyma dairenensis CBS 421]